jgi:amino acid transporter
VTAGQATGKQVTVAETHLKAGALGLPSIFMQSMTQISPGIAALFYTPFVVANAGLAAPLAYPIGFVIVLITAFSFAELANAVPSAGGYYTYVARGIHPVWGFLVAWVNLIYTPLVLGSVLVFGGWVWATSLNWPLWWPFAYLFLASGLVALLQYRGVQISGKTLVVMGGIELVVVFLLGVWGILDPGPGGFNFKPFDISQATGAGPGVLLPSGLALAGVFAIQAFSGWEGATPMAEESSNPRRTVRLALIGSVVIFGIFIVIVQWGVMLGWGTDNFAKIPTSPELPGITLAKKFWGDLWVVLLVMLMTSTIAVSLACANVSTRMYYKMARDGVAPKWLAFVHPTYKTPSHAVIAQLAIAIIWGFVMTGLAILANPADTSIGTAESNQYYIYGTSGGFALIFIYVSVNIACFLLYWRERRREFSWVRHALLPVLSSLGMFLVGWVSLNPAPAAPFFYAIPVTFGWLVIGIIVVIALRFTGNSDWMDRAMQAAAERPATDEEIEAMRGEW